MAGIPLSFEIFNAREEVESSDLVRGEKLLSREVQDVARNESRGEDSVDVATGAFKIGQGDVINGAEVQPLLTAIPATFKMTLSDGWCWKDDPTLYGTDDSPYQAVRWTQVDVDLSDGGANPPDPVNPRVDLIFATPASVQTDLASRNILTNPVARTIAPQNVPKTQNPAATIVHLVGVPAPLNPEPPALPAGSLALFEVFVPAAAADSTLFLPARRTFKRNVGALSTYHGILKNCVVANNVVDEIALAGAGIAFSEVAPFVVNKAIIDGELISFFGGGALVPAAAPTFVRDTGANDPFDVAAPAAVDRPYFLYLVGGRNSPQGRLNVGATGFSPVCVVESLVAPNKDGHPSALIQPARGPATQAGALYIGVGFTVKNSVLRKSCLIAGDWIYAVGGSTAVNGFDYPSFNEAARVFGGAATQTFPLAAKPSTSTAAKIVIASGVSTIVAQARGISAAPDQTLGVLLASTQLNLDIPLAAVVGVPGTEFKIVAAGAGTNYFAATAYNMRVPRLSE